MGCLHCGSVKMGCLHSLAGLLLLLRLSLAAPLPSPGLSLELEDWAFAETAVREMQRAFGLHESGELTAQTLAAMRRPRCGLSDAEEFGPLMRWINRTLTYRIEGSVPTVRPFHVRKAFREAWKLWTEVAPLKFRRRSRREADIIVTFTKRDHGDGSSFDGRGGILAHAFQPGTGIGGDVHFDVEEDWTVSTKGHNLFAVAVHEFGHTLGLPHSPDPGAVMYPAYNFVSHTDFQLSFQDVQDIQKMYGFVSMLCPP
ncbi:collagenase 3-like [Sardina pilchardus]|uniref:collagenase 3-like n=1 Tax=Sardina pilchardus TaxID=27697 RepID=UPI002E0EABEB